MNLCHERFAGVVDNFRQTSGRSVDNQADIPKPRITAMRDVDGLAVAVDTRSLVYAGRYPGYPQSTGVITAISIHPTDTNNHPVRPLS